MVPSLPSSRGGRVQIIPGLGPPSPTCLLGLPCWLQPANAPFDPIQLPPAPPLLGTLAARSPQCLTPHGSGSQMSSSSFGNWLFQLGCKLKNQGQGLRFPKQTDQGLAPQMPPPKLTSRVQLGAAETRVPRAHPAAGTGVQCPGCHCGPVHLPPPPHLHHHYQEAVSAPPPNPNLI